MKFVIGDKVIFKKGDWLDHCYIDNCRGTIIDNTNGYMIEWQHKLGNLGIDFYNIKDEEYLHYDIKTIRNIKLKELGLL